MSTTGSWADLPIQPTINFHPLPTLHKPSSSSPNATLPPNATMEQALEVITRLQQELQMTEQEIEDLEMELMEVIQARDQRKLRGGSADSLTYCPLCYTNLEPEEGQPTRTSPKRTESGKKVQQERKMMKAQRKTLIQSSQTISLPALTSSARPMSISGSATTMSDRSSTNSHLNSISSAAVNMNNRRMM
eukprot:scaffold5237_cov170-Ochromonas_danica.AAC.6